MDTLKQEQHNLTIVFLITVFGFILLRTAWVCDDAYITFRTVDNFVHGLGLRWNPDERVQTYTHPLWMMLMSGVYFFTREAFFTSITVSVVISLAAVTLMAQRIALTPLQAVLGLLMLIFSKTFVDYSTSGLENALMHLILAGFLTIYFTREMDARTLGWLSLVAALGTLNRMDTILIFMPALAWGLYRLRTLKALAHAALGFTPFVLWLLFSLIYYGFFFPNTAYAKLNINASSWEIMRQGCYYLINSIDNDPLTMIAITLGLVSTVIFKQWKQLPIALGIGLYLIYIVRIGGDFMQGRFLAAPLLCAVALIARCNAPSFRAMGYLPLAVVLLVGLSSPFPPLLSNSFITNSKNLVDNKGIADERACYYGTSSLMKVGQGVDMPSHTAAKDGRMLRTKGWQVIDITFIGYIGYFAGPQVHFIDKLGLGDPLLARMKPIKTPTWRPGHLVREIPAGYIDTIKKKGKMIQNRNIALYYDKLELITRGPIWSGARWAEIWRMNTGQTNALLDSSTPQPATAVVLKPEGK